MSTRRAFLQSALLLPSLLSAQAFAAQENKALPFADFENGSWGNWTVEGEAFGSSPATDALFPGKIRGFGGNGFVCTLHPKKGNAAVGKAVSREFTIEKPFITFKIGGGNFPGAACLNLVVDGQVTHTATGNGTASFSDASWDVSALIGKKAHLEIIDATASAERGYVMVDDIAFTDRLNTRLQKQVDELVQAYRVRYDYPAVWAAVSIRGALAASSVDGVRKLGSSVVAGISDRLMIGSVSKPVTGTLVGILIDKGVLKWDTTVRDILPDLGKYSKRHWLDATVLQLSTHISGCPQHPKTQRFDHKKKKTDLRYEFVQGLLENEEQGLPGQKYAYSGGHTVIGAMIERLLQKPFEQIITEHIYQPLQINNGGTGSPVANDSDTSQPWGHQRWTDTGVTTAGRYTKNNPSTEFNCSGAIHMSIVDLVNFGAWHATNGRTQPALCSKDGIQNMYIKPTESTTMACGLDGDVKTNCGHRGATAWHWTNLRVYSEVLDFSAVMT